MDSGVGCGAAVGGPAAAHRYLAAVRQVRVDGYDAGWIGDVARPKLAVQCYELGRDLAWLRPKAGVALLERSLALRYTDEDRRIMEQRSRHMATIRDQERSFERTLRDATRHELMHAYKRAGYAKRAQALLEELTKRYPNGIPPAGLAQFAGQVQAGAWEPEEPEKARMVGGVHCCPGRVE